MDEETLGADEQVLERIGLNIADAADNFLALAANAFMPPQMRIDALLTGMKQIRDEAREIYVALGGEDWWSADDLDCRDIPA